MTDLTDERLPPKHGWRPDGSDPLALKLWEIRHQLYCNVEIVKRGHPDPEPRILPHVIETLTDHVYDRLNELESILTHRTNGGEAVAWRFRQKGMTLWSHMEDRPPLGADGMSAHEWECEPLYASPVAIPQDGTSGVRVKALEWRYYPDAFPPAWDAPTAFGRYSIEEGMIANTEDPTWHSDSYPTWNVDFSGGLLSVWRSLDEAKAAAQTDYETRILAALIREAIAALSGESPADKRGLAWLIEMDGPVWWAGRGHNPPEWTRDASKAVRFCRREDAEQGMWALDIAQGHMRPTEHVFLFNLSSEGSPS